MVQHIRPSTQTKLRIVPRDGELEITLNINISVDGKLVASAENADVIVEEDNEKVEHIVPDFASGLTLSFGKEEVKQEETNGNRF